MNKITGKTVCMNSQDDAQQKNQQGEVPEWHAKPGWMRPKNKVKLLNNGKNKVKFLNGKVSSLRPGWMHKTKSVHNLSTSPGWTFPNETDAK
jgi:hypothetical protein